MSHTITGFIIAAAFGIYAGDFAWGISFLRDPSPGTSHWLVAGVAAAAAMVLSLPVLLRRDE